MKWGGLQDGRGVRRGDHYPHQKYIKNTSTCGTTPAEHLLNADRRPQTSQKARKSPRTWVGRKKKEKTQKNRDRTCTSGRELWRRKSFHTLGSPFTGGDGGWAGGKLWSHWGECSNRGAEGKVERFPHRGSVPTSTHQRERLVCRAGSWGSGLEVRSQGEDWGWLCEDSQKGASAPQLAGRKSRKQSGPAKEARDHSFRVREERGFLPRVPTERRAPPKRAPETGASCGYQLGLQRWAWNANATAAVTKNPMCNHRSLPTTPHPPPPGACAARHCQDPMIQGQLPWKNTQRASGCCNVMLASAATG